MGCGGNYLGLGLGLGEVYICMGGWVDGWMGGWVDRLTQE